MGKTSGTLQGAGTGAAVGTAIMPGIGTAIGAIGGGIMGYLGSSSDQHAGQYAPNAQNFMYGGNMSGQAKRQIAGYDAQGNELRNEATQSQQRAIGDNGAQGFAGNAANNANAAVAGNNINQARGQQVDAFGRMQQGNNQLAAFANQPQGPSAAQAQLQQGANQSFAQQMAAARSGTNAGGGAAAMRNAQMQQAGIMGNADMQSAQLRAQEGQAFQQQRLQALGAAQQGYGAEAGAAAGMRGSDLNAAQLQAGTALGAGQLQAGTAQNFGNQQLQNRNINNQYSLGLGQLAQGQDQMTQNVYQQQLAATMGAEQLYSQNYNAAQGYNVQAQNANTAGQYGMASAGMGAAAQMSSDTREKKDIAHAQGVSDALAAFGYPDNQRMPDGALLPRVGHGDDPWGQYGQGSRAAASVDRDTSEFSPSARSVTLYHQRDASSPMEAQSMPANYELERSDGRRFRADELERHLREINAPPPIDQSTVHHAQMPRNEELAALGYYDRPQTSAVAHFPNAPGVAQPESIPTARFPDVNPSTDMRGAPAYEYGYKNPFAAGAAPGRHVGPMAQDLEQNPATAGAVTDTPHGKMVDPGRLTMVNTSAIGEQQNRIDMLEQQLAAMGVPPKPKPNMSSYGGVDLDALDEANARDRAYR